MQNNTNTEDVGSEASNFETSKLQEVPINSAINTKPLNKTEKPKINILLISAIFGIFITLSTMVAAYISLTINPESIIKKSAKKDSAYNLNSSAIASES